MDDGLGALRNRFRAGLPASVLTPVRRRSMDPRHRRRRAAAALAILLAAALVVALLAWAGGGGRAARHLTASPTGGFFAQIRTLAGNGGGSLETFERAAENGAINRTLGYTPYVRIAGAQHRELALTFDDGPGPYTPKILAVLEREHVPATFFEIGVIENYFHASTEAIAQQGYPLGDHTFGHVLLTRLKPADQRRQLLHEATVLRRYGAPFPRLFRPPYGLWNRATLALLRRLRMLMVLWTG